MRRGGLRRAGQRLLPSRRRHRARGHSWLTEVGKGVEVGRWAGGTVQARVLNTGTPDHAIKRAVSMLGQAQLARPRCEAVASSGRSFAALQRGRSSSARSGIGGCAPEYWLVQHPCRAGGPPAESTQQGLPRRRPPLPAVSSAAKRAVVFASFVFTKQPARIRQVLGQVRPAPTARRKRRLTRRCRVAAA